MPLSMADHHFSPPPKFARKFLLWFLRDDLKEEVEGDLLEKYLLLAEKSPETARWNYWIQVINYCRPFAFRSFHVLPNLYPAMLKNYIKITFRSLFRQWNYAFINIFGLSVSLAVVLLMLLWVHDEWKTDRFHEKDDRLYRVKRTIPMEGNHLDVYRNISYPMMEAAASEIPEVEAYAAVPGSFEDHLQWKDKVLRARGAYANADYFQVFSYPVILGDIRQLDEKANAIVLTKTLAQNFFGHRWQSEALGSTIHIHDNGDFSVEAIIEDYPPRSSVQNDFLYSIQSYLDKNDWMLNWFNNGMQGVLLLREGANPSVVEKKLQALFHAQQEGERKEGCIFQKYADDYLFSEFDNQAQVAGGRIEYVRLFLVAAFLLLIISCINFVNLATARASKRALEVGVRKTVGASRPALASQFIVEASLLTFLSVVIALVLARVLVPPLELLTAKTFVIEYLNPGLWLSVLGITLFTAFLSGAYPAFVLSSFRPRQAIQTKISDTMGGVSFRKILVIVQFALSLLLIVAAVVIRSQIFYIQNKHLGLDKEHVLMIHQDAKINEKYTVLKRELEAEESITGVTVAGPNPHRMSASTGGVEWPKKRPDQSGIEIAILWGAHDFPEVFNIPLVAGRYYRESEYPDSLHIVLNEKAVEVMELGDDPIGQTIRWWGQTKQVIGVLKNFHNQSLYRDIQPAGFLLEPENAGNLFIKYQGGKIAEAIPTVEKIFDQVLPDVPLHYDFLDESTDARYQAEMLTGTLADYFAIIAIVISCLGLLGLITFVAEQRKRELGIRKVLGANMSSLIVLMTKDFLYLVIVAFVVAIPISYFLLNRWLNNFAYQTDVNWWSIFAAAGCCAVVLTALTIGFQSIKSALRSPVESLRME